jgi:soluble lytic murein transglycosylase-like protein
MSVCFNYRSCLFLLGSCLISGQAPATAESLPEASAPARRLTTVVKIDPRSGRLTRSVVAAPPRPMLAKAIAPVPAEIGDRGAVNPVAADAKLEEIVEDAARRNEVDPLLVHSVIQVESNYNANAVSPKGAQGLMQLIPSTARRFGAKNSFDVKENVEAGVKYLKYLNSLYPNDLRLTLAAYNAGEGAVAKYRNNIPPYRETEHYVYKVGEKYGSARRAAEQRKAAATAVTEKTAAVERHFPVESFLDSEGHLHMRTVAPSEGTPQ